MDEKLKFIVGGAILLLVGFLIGNYVGSSTAQTIYYATGAKIVSGWDNETGLFSLANGTFIINTTTGNATMRLNLILNGTNISADNIFANMTGNLSGSATDLYCEACIGATEISDIYVFTAGDTMAGNLDMAGNNISATNVTATNFYGNLAAAYIQSEPWIEDVQEDNLNVNSSVFWDGISSMDQISGLGVLQSNVTIDNQGGDNISSFYLRLLADNNGTEVEGNMQMIYGDEPYLQVAVSNFGNSSTEIIPVLDIHESELAFSTDAVVNIGHAGGNRPLNIFTAGYIDTSGGYQMGGQPGITNDTLWLCTSVNCATTCQANFNGGILIGCT